SRGGSCGARPRGIAQNLDRKTGYPMSVDAKQTGIRKKGSKAQPAPKAEDTSEAVSMDEVWIEGGRKLRGSVPVSGSKNATLPILAATLLSPGIYRFTNVPNLKDVSTMLELLSLFGVRSKRDDDHGLFVDSTNAQKAEPPTELLTPCAPPSSFRVPLPGRFAERGSWLPGG